MNIAFVNSTKKWGGVKTWILDFAEQFRLRGHNVFVWGRQPVFVEKAKRKAGHGELATFGPDFNPLAVYRFMRDFKRNDIKAVFVNVGKDLTTAGVAARLLGIPVLQQIGLPGDIAHRAKTEFLHKWIKPLFYCSCRNIRDGFLEALPYVDKERTKVILTAKECSSHPLKVNRPLRFVCSSQLNSDKGHADVLNALARVEGDFECRILGTGTIEKELKELANSLGLADKVKWLGFSEDVLGELRNCDVFFLASYSEGLPNTLQEAMAEGLIPIARDVGGVNEVWPPELNEYFLPFQSGPDEFTKAVESLMGLPDERLLELKEHSRNACRQHFDLHVMADEFEAWVTRVVVK